MKKILLLTFLIGGLIELRAQSREEIIRQYIDTYKELAIEEMLRTGVPASIKLAQGIHETEAGQSVLVQKSNNHFGIKCKSTWTGERVSHTDDAPNECFRKYPSAIDSYRDHSNFLKGNTRYAFLFNLDPEDYQSWAYGLKRAGYATNPRYPQVIIKLIEDFQLNDYTLIALGKMDRGAHWVKNEIPVKEQEEQTPPAVTEQEVTEAPAVVEPEISYPEGEFKLNETRVVFARAGTSLLGLAEQYGLPLARIYEFNELPVKDLVENDQLIYLQRKRKTGNDITHIVKPGETLHSIAQTQAIRLASLLEYNYLGYGMQPAPGEILYLRAKAPAQPKLVKR